MRIYKCKKCGNIVIQTKEGPTPICCGEEMTLLSANTEDAAVEKHVPVVTKEGNLITVVCGEVPHPMEEAHYIEFLIVETTKGYQIKYLNPGEEAKATFTLTEEELVSAYAYCNLHGLWKNK